MAYDTRAFAGGIGNTLTLEKVNINTKDIVTMYTAPNPNPTNGFGPGTAAVSFFPDGRHGHCHSWHRRCAVQPMGPVRRDGQPNRRHRQCRYFRRPRRDRILYARRASRRNASPRAERRRPVDRLHLQRPDYAVHDLGTTSERSACTKLGIPVDVDDALGNQDGVGFTVLVAKVKRQADIAPGSDDIFQASEDAWVGEKGYQTAATGPGNARVPSSARR